jgi:hypothetical protein
MYDDQNTSWFSQTLLTFKDKQFATDGYLKIAISTNTENYKFFNPPLFNISISTNIQKTYNLNIQQAEDLLDSFNQVLKQSNGNEIVIEKKYQKNSNIYFKFDIEKTNNIRVVVIEIISNQSDLSRIIIPLKPTFQSLLRRLKYFVEYYDQLCFNLLTKSIDCNSIQIIDRIPSLIKGISSQIVSSIPGEVLEQDSPTLEISLEEVQKTEATINDLDNFLGNDMKNINLPEIDEKKAEMESSIVEVKSDFINKVLSNNLMNIENKLISFAVSKQPILDLSKELEVELQLSLLNSVSEEERNSIVYISTLIQNYYIRSYTINDKPIPSSIGVIRFDGNPNEKNIEFAKDILLIIGYIRTVRRRLESKIRSIYDNKSAIYLYLRCFMDPFCFSFIGNLSKNDLVSAITNRYIYFDKVGFFDEYKTLLQENECKPIVKEEIIEFIEEVSNSSLLLVDEMHKKLYESGNVKLPTKNKFSLEQIINEFIPIEVDCKLGFDFKNKEAVENYKKSNNISDEVLQIFMKNDKSTKSLNMQKITPLQRWVEKYKQDIPEQYQDSFIEYIKSLQFNKYNFEEKKFPLSEFDENIVKALYVWDVDVDPEMKSNFTRFATLVENEQMTKESILIVIESFESESDWNNLNLGE